MVIEEMSISSKLLAGHIILLIATGYVVILCFILDTGDF